MFVKRALSELVQTILGSDGSEILPTGQLLIAGAAILFFVTGLAFLATIV